ncbi:MAG TPA: GTPase Era [Rhodospirillales bacterium]|nr:GTPase Era [Rhodospirillales bacterium]
MTEGCVDSRCEFIAVVGAPNVGKSTLVNRFVGAKVTIVSPKAQTTRARVLGICIEDLSQLVFIDTPGIFEPRRRLDRAMVAAAWGGASDGDVILLLVDANSGVDSNTRKIIEGLKKRGKTVDNFPRIMLVLNKIDVTKKPALLTLAAQLNEEGIFSETFMVSALSGNGVGDLLAHLAGHAPKGPWHFPEDQISDMPQRLLAAEITREKLYLQLRQELPYASAVETEEWHEKEDGSVKISQVIYIERPTQKAIILGKGGGRIKSIGEASRKELKEIFGHDVHLFLFVKVREKWGDDQERYRDWGLDFNA